jgi:hypothetical protein
MKVGLDKKSQELLDKLINQLDRFNDNLEDFKTMIAPILGFKVKKKGVK